jgi:hypothetical protein
MPKPERTDWSGWCAKSIRAIVRERACPTCGAPAGVPCRNQLFGVAYRIKSGKYKRRQRLNYQNYVHRTRRRKDGQA